MKYSAAKATEENDSTMAAIITVLYIPLLPILDAHHPNKRRCSTVKKMAGLVGVGQPDWDYN
jgi:hypothetical protein